MTMLGMSSDVCQLPVEEEPIFASFTQRLIEFAAVSGAHETAASPIAALNAMRLPAIALNQHGLVAEVNAAADAVFDQNINIKDRRLFVRDPDARTLLKNAVDQLKALSRLDSWLWSRSSFLGWTNYRSSCAFGPSREHPGQDVRALLTLNALGPKPGPSAAILAKTFRLTPSEAKVACIIARGAPPDIAARELKISRETARNQLKSVFAKTDTHRQSELVALLLQVE